MSESTCPDLNAITAPLLDWFAKNQRDLPWRHTTDPYAIWVSEIMLQQTRVEAVKGYYERFLAAFPTLSALAAADEGALLKAWEGLGYYSRARNLRAAAQRVMTEYGGALPPSREALKTLEGIGDYTAGSIASIAFQLPEPAVDGNVLRVLTRFLASDANVDRPATRAHFAALLKPLYTPACARALTESLMELGALVCLPGGAPKCDRCPLAFGCRALPDPTRFPVHDAPRARKVQPKTLLALETPGGFYLEKRTNGLLKGMWQFPLLDAFLSAEQVEEQLERLGFVGGVRPIAHLKHTFTHVEWDVAAFYGRGEGRGSVPWERLGEFPLPGAMQKFLPAIAAARLQAEGEENGSTQGK